MARRLLNAIDFCPAKDEERDAGFRLFFKKTKKRKRFIGPNGLRWAVKPRGWTGPIARSPPTPLGIDGNRDDTLESRGEEDLSEEFRKDETGKEVFGCSLM
jgi:hypothetical protein